MLLVWRTEPWWWGEEAWALGKGILAMYAEAQCLLLHGHWLPRKQQGPGMIRCGTGVREEGVGVVFA